MINVRPGYWDVDRCSWVGVDPLYVVPPLRHAEHPHDSVPAPRAAEDHHVEVTLTEPVEIA